jgi:hypothetical protein
MKSLSVGLLALALVSFIGCESHNQPGGPGVNRAPGTSPTTPPPRNEPSGTSNRPVIGHAEETFTLHPPSSLSLRQGETKAANISIKRGKNFDEDVTVKFSGIPQGVTFEPPTGMLKHSENEVKFNVHAGPDAAVGEFTIQMTGHPTKGADATSDLKLKVAKK